jgi:hypothetical protein
MIFATAIFYAEPCYDLQTCTFTDIFNTGYFVMLTYVTESIFKFPMKYSSLLTKMC